MKEKLMKAVCFALIVYLFGCYLEIVTKNTAPNPTYSNLNVIVSSVERGRNR